MVMVVEGLTLDNSVESVVIISGVLNSALVTIWVNNAVRSMDSISITRFSLFLNITGVGIMNSIGEVVFGVSIIINFLLDVVMDWFHVVISWFYMMISWFNMGVVLLNMNGFSVVDVMMRVNMSCAGKSGQSQESYTLEMKGF